MVLRLYEEDFIDRKKADELLNVDNSVIEEEIRLIGISNRWQNSSGDIIELGSLIENMRR